MEKTMEKQINSVSANGLGSGQSAQRVQSKKALKTTPLAGKNFLEANTVSIKRHFTSAAETSPLDAVLYVKATAKIKDTDGQTVFEMKDCEVPAVWSQLAIDILVSKYFRKAGDRRAHV